MIDIESMVVNAVRNAVKTKYPKCDIVSEYVDTPSQFPCVQILEADNYTYRRTQDNNLLEHHANVMYEVNVFSNKTDGKKAEAKAIMVCKKKKWISARNAQTGFHDCITESQRKTILPAFMR